MNVEVLDKSSLRRRALIKRRELSRPERRRLQTQLDKNLSYFLENQENEQKFTLLAFQALKEEAAAELGVREVHTYYPKVEGDSLQFFKPKSKSDLKLGKFGVLEPNPKTSVPLGNFSNLLVLCPAVQVNYQGVRLGFGKGFYDRFLNQHPEAIRIAVVFHFQLTNQDLPRNEWDAGMDWVVSDEGILRIFKRSA